jgi:hypothetical protein
MPRIIPIEPTEGVDHFGEPTDEIPNGHMKLMNTWRSIRRGMQGYVAERSDAFPFFW